MANRVKTNSVRNTVVTTEESARNVRRNSFLVIVKKIHFTIFISLGA